MQCLLLVEPLCLEPDLKSEDCLQVERINQAAFWFFGSADNYYHCLGEYAPQLHHLICQMLDLCNYDPAADLRIFRLNQAHVPGAQPLPAAIDEVLECFSPDPVLHLGHEAYNNKVHVALQRHPCPWYILLQHLAFDEAKTDLQHQKKGQKLKLQIRCDCVRWTMKAFQQAAAAAAQQCSPA